MKIEHKHTSRGWDHQHTHFHFLRRTPAGQRHIPLSTGDDWLPSTRKVIREVSRALAATAVFAAMIGVAVMAPVWTGWL